MKLPSQFAWSSKTLPIMICTLLFSIVGLSAQVLAAPTFKVGIIDPQQVIEKSRAGKRALETLKEHATVRQKLLANDESELKSLEAKLRENSSLSDSEKQARQETFRKKLQEYQKRGQEFQQELGIKQKELVMEYMKKIETATKAVAEKHGFSMIVDKGSDSTLRIVLYSRKGLNITSEVVKEFDRRYK
ncbi:MAG: OmpH family outer membrane protein [Nitrospirae bacterium]|nr:OmpH family outer membrane protein [Nitrospirota bacterium]